MDFAWRGVVTVFVLMVVPVLLAPEPMTASDTIVTIQPPVSQVAPGRLATVVVQVDRTPALGAFEFGLSFDPSILQVVAVEPGDFLTASRRELLPIGPDIQGAQVIYGNATYGHKSGISGWGVLAYVTFQVTGTGTSRLQLEYLIAADTSGNMLSVRWTDGQVTGSYAMRRVQLPLVSRIP